MKIVAMIPTSKKQDLGWISFPHEAIEVEVARVLRTRCDRTRERYHYIADVKCPPQLHPEAPNILGECGLYRVNVFIRLNPKWKKPVFEKGVMVMEVQPEHGE